MLYAWEDEPSLRNLTSLASCFLSYCSLLSMPIKLFLKLLLYCLFYDIFKWRNSLGSELIKEETSKLRQKDCVLLLKPSVGYWSVSSIVYSMTCNCQWVLPAPKLNLGLTTKENFEKLFLKAFYQMYVSRISWMLPINSFNFISLTWAISVRLALSKALKQSKANPDISYPKSVCCSVG